MRDKIMAENWQDKVKNLGKGIWSEVKDARAFFNNGTPALLKETDEGVSEVNREAYARKELSANDVVYMYSLRIRAKDTHSPRRIVETWLTGSLLKRIIVMSPYPTRRDAKINHDKYVVAMAYLTKNGVVVRQANGFRWSPEFSALPTRAEWLIHTLKTKGEMRNKVEGRYYIL
jgi:hypothetical protein